MEKIKEYIREEMEKYSNQRQYLNEKEINNKNDPDESIKKEFNLWIENLNINMYLCKYRKVLNEIENYKQNFESIPSLHWKYKIIQLKAIFHIIKKKMVKYSIEMTKENSKKYLSVLFWFNYSFIILEQLILQFRGDINDNINLKSKSVLIPIQYIFLGHIQLLYLLIKFSYSNNQIPEICAYFSMVDRLVNYSGYIVNINTLPLLQKIYLFRVKLCLANCDYLNGMKYIKKTIDFCTAQLMYIIDFDLNIEKIDTYIKDRRNPYHINRMNKKILEEIFINISMAFYLRGVLSELIGNVSKAIDSYKQSKFFTTKFLKNKFYNFSLLFNALQNNGYKYLSVMDDFKELKEKKQLEKIIQNDYLMKKKYYEQIKYEENYNKFYSSIRTKGNLYQGNLKKFLDSAGEKLYKEELNRNSVLKKFTKTNYITSTMKMINNLLSKDFKNILKKMDKVEVTKPSDEINSLINWALIRKRQIIYNKKNKSKDKNKENIINKNIENTNNSFTEMKNERNRQINSARNRKINYKNKSADNFANKIEPINNIKNNKFKERPLTVRHIHNKNKLYYRLNRSNSKLINNRNNSNLNIKKINNKINKSELSSMDTFDNEYSNRFHYLLDNNNISIAKNSFHIKSSSTVFLKGNKKKYNENNSSKNLVLMQNHNKNNNYSKILNDNKIFLKFKPKQKKEFRIDKENFEKKYLEKKIFLDKICNEEIKFHRKLLNSKSCELELTKEPNEFNPKREKKEAERTFNKILELCKLSTIKKNIDNYMKRRILGNSNMKINMNIKGDMSINNSMNKNDFYNLYDILKEDRTEDRILDEKEKKKILRHNEDIMKELNMEYEQMVNKEKDIKIKKKKLLDEIIRK